MVFCRLALTVILLGTIPPILAQSRTDSADSSAPKLILVISSDKSVYRIGEPIVITVTLRNDSNIAVWMSKPLGVGRYPGEFYIDLLGPDGALQPNASPVVDGPAEPAKSEQAGSFDYFLCKRVPLLPGEFWGIRGKLEDVFVSPNRPGRYTIVAKFLEEDIAGMRKIDLQNLKQRAHFPIRTQAVTSEPLAIEIR